MNEEVGVELETIREEGCEAGTPQPMCDHICLLPADHLDRGQLHFHGYRHPSPVAECERLAGLLDEARDRMEIVVLKLEAVERERDEAVELLTTWLQDFDDYQGVFDGQQSTRAFLVRLGRDQWEGK